MKYNPERVLRFPDAKIGWVATEPRGIPADLDDGRQFYKDFDDAKGEVRVERRKRLWLNISENHKEALACLHTIPPRAIYELSISLAQNGTKFAIAAQRFTNMRCLSIDECSRTKSVFEYLSSWPYLTSLNLSRTKVEFIRDIESHGALTHLWLSDTKVGDEFIRTTANMSQLKTMDISDSAVTPACFRWLPRSLVELRIGYMKIGATDFATLDLPNLKTLKIEGGKLDPKCLHSLQRLRRLKNVQMTNTSIKDGEWPRLFSDTTAENISFRGTNLGDSGARALSEVRSLKSVSIADGPVSDLGALFLAEQPNLEFLSLGWTDVTDITADAILRNGFVHSLGLHDTLVTDHGFVNAASATELTHLNLDLTTITDATLERLISAPSLKYLSCYSTDVTRDGIEAFRSRMPGCEVKWSFKELEESDRKRRRDRTT